MFVTMASAETIITSQDEVVIKISAKINATLIKSESFSDVTYLFTEADFTQENPVVLINTEDMSIMIAGNNYCSLWLIKDNSIFLMLVEVLDSEESQKLFDVQYSS